MSDGKRLLRVIRIISCVLAIGLSMSADASWFEFGGDRGATVEILQATNISSKVTAIGGFPRIFIKGISGDGTVVVGQFRSKQAPNKLQIFRYTQSNGVENIGSMGSKGLNTNDLCISADGSVIWGTFHIENDGSHVFRYTKSNGFQDLGTMGKKSIAVYGASADGSVIVGSFLYLMTPENFPVHHAFRFSQSQGFEDLGNMGGESAHARGISADGSLIVGNFQLADTSSHAFRYSRSDGVQDIGVGGVAAFATSISNEGSVIVGMFFGEFSFINYKHYNHVFIYTKASGVQKLGAMGGRSVGVPSISADGTKIIGSYTDSNGESYVYMAKIVLPEVQETK